MLLDHGPIYTNSGNILQLEYSKKCVDNGSTCISFKYKDGIIIAVENPVESKLYKTPKRIKTISPNIYIVATGLQSDSIFVTKTIKDNIHNEASKLDILVTAASYKRTISELIAHFTKKNGVRPIGCAFISAIYDGDFHVLSTDSTSYTQECVGTAVGKGMQRARTELEKLDLIDCDLNQAMNNAVRILYKSYDPLKDKSFTIEMGYMNRETEGKMVIVESDYLNDIVDAYKDLSVDE